MSDATLRQVVAEAVPHLVNAGIEDPRREAELLLCHVINRDSAYLIGHADAVLEAGHGAVFNTLLERRVGREPMSQILGMKEFWSLDFRVGPATLSPRPESETVVETVLDELPDECRAPRLLDLGTGTGCLLVTLLHELPGATGLGVDRSSEALAIARDNASRLGVGDRASFVAGDWADTLGERFDVIVTNPPYIETAVLEGLEPEVAQWEPRLALDGGDDGLAAYRRIVPQLGVLLRDQGFAVLEYGPDQADAIEALGRENRLRPTRRCDDLGGKPRCVVFTR